MKILGLIGLILMPLFAAPVLALSGRPIQAGAAVLVVGPPGRLAAILDQAGGRPIGPTRAPLAIIAAADHDPAHFPERLRQAGAWLVFDADATARICGVTL